MGVHMKNREKYKGEIITCCTEGTLGAFYDAHIQPIYHTLSYHNLPSAYACLLVSLWLDEEYQEPEPDWSKVKTDELIQVRNDEDNPWISRHFAKYEDGIVYVWAGGTTSFTSNGHIEPWEFAELAEREE